MNVDIFNTDRKYNIVYADPPWQYNDKMKMKGVHGDIRGAESFYHTMGLKEIKQLPVSKIISGNALLFMWVTMPFLNKAFDVMSDWGFTYKTCGFCWIKKNKNNNSNCLGMGHYTRSNAELCLLGTSKGIKTKEIIKSHSISSVVETIGENYVVESVRREHSRKPDEVRERIVELCGDLPRIELFAREEINGWDCWGNETDRFKTN